MRISLIFIALVGAVVLPAHAADLHPFVSGTFNVNVPTEGFADGNFSRQQGGARPGIGEEVEAGLSSGTFSSYLGYRWEHFDATGHLSLGTDTYHADGVWRIFRWVLGARWRVVDKDGAVPLIGAGFTWERTDITMRAANTPVPLSTVKMSGPSLGWFAETGVEIPVGKRIDLIGGVQFHHQISPVNSTTPGVLHGQVPISHMTAEAGFRLNLF